MLAWPVASIGWVTSLIQRAAASQERINEFLKITPRIVNYNKRNTPIKGDIKFDNVQLIYKDTEISALNKLSFNIKEGETLGVFGKTGSGKSTIANLICRILESTEGNIYYNNISIKDLNLNLMLSMRRKLKLQLLRQISLMK